jgi:multicomponent K+:H+ antiporter subunit G
MSTAADMPLWLAWVIVVLAGAGAALSLTGAVGLIRLKSFYDRVHAPTLGATLGTVLIVFSSIAFAYAAEGRLVLRDLLIILFITITTPVTLVLLARAAVYRDRVEGQPGAPDEP